MLSSVLKRRKGRILGLIAAASLLVGGIGVKNAMN